MIREIGRYIDLGSQYYGLEISQTKDQDNFLLVKVKRKGQELVIEEQAAFGNFEDVVPHLKSSSPLFLAFNTKGTVTKSTGNSQQKGKALVNSIFPNFDDASLFFQHYQLAGQGFVSIIGREVVNGWLQKFEESGISVVAFSIGLSGMSQILHFLKATEINGASFQLVISPEDGKIQLAGNVQNGDTTYDLNGLKIQGTFLLAFGALVSGMGAFPKESSNFFQFRLSLKNAFRDKRRLSLLIRTSLIVFLSVLLINFVCFDYYFGKAQALQNEIAFSENNRKKLVELRESIAKKETRVTKALSSSKSAVSYYLDQLAQSIPGTIGLNELIYQPLKRPKSPAKPIEYSTGEITILGQTRGHRDFINWVSQMEKLDWIASIETLEFDYQNQNSSVFKLNITLANENQ